MDQITSSVIQLLAQATNKFFARTTPSGIDVFEEMDCGVCDMIISTSTILQDSSSS